MAEHLVETQPHEVLSSNQIYHTLVKNPCKNRRQKVFSGGALQVKIWWKLYWFIVFHLPIWGQSSPKPCPVASGLTHAVRTLKYSGNYPLSRKYESFLLLEENLN